MVAKLGLPFPLLSDPDRSQAIEPYGVGDAHDKRNIARPATIVVGPDGNEVWRVEGRDYADRPIDDDVLAAVERLGLSPTTQSAPLAGDAEAGAAAFPLEQLVPYYRGARFAAVAMGRRFPDAKDDADAYVAMLDRFTDAVKARYKAAKSES